MLQKKHYVCTFNIVFISQHGNTNSSTTIIPQHYKRHINVSRATKGRRVRARVTIDNHVGKSALQFQGRVKHSASHACSCPEKLLEQCLTSMLSIKNKKIIKNIWNIVLLTTKREGAQMYPFLQIVLRWALCDFCVCVYFFLWRQFETLCENFS